MSVVLFMSARWTGNDLSRLDPEDHIVPVAFRIDEPDKASEFKLCQTEIVNPTSPPPFAINNPGQLCYAISTLQALYASDVLRNRIIVGYLNSKASSAILDVLYPIFLDMQESSLTLREMITEEQLRDLVALFFGSTYKQRGRKPIDIIHKQNDANELAVKLIDGDYMRGGIGMITKDLISVKVQEKIVCRNCNATSRNFFDTDNSIIVHVPEDSEFSLTIDAMIDSIINSEYRLPSDTKCDCGTIGTKYVERNILTPPIVLVVRQSRTKGRGTTYLKNKTPVRIREELSLTVGNEVVQYNLVSMTCHMGYSNRERIDSGHYISFCKYDGKWYVYDDRHRDEMNPFTAPSHAEHLHRSETLLVYELACTVSDGK